MNRSETAALLGLAAARDRRTVGEIDVLAWHTDLGDLDFVDAKQALERHYRESTDYLMPAHIRTHARVIRDERRRGTSEALVLPSRFENPASLDIRMQSGIASCRQVLGQIMARLAASREPAGELSPSEQRRQLAIQRARAERRVNHHTTGAP